MPGASWAHVRRKFYELRVTYSRESKEALDLIDALFLLEREMPAPYDLDGDTKEAALDIRRLRRGVESRSRAAELRAWAERQTALPRSALADAIRYMLDHWAGLTLFLDDPMVDLDNNGTERALRGMVLGRKNHYGSRSLRGTQVAAIFYTLIETCLLCDVDPEEYLRFAARAALVNPGTVTLPQDFARGREPAG